MAYCIRLRSGVDVWITDQQMRDLSKLLIDGQSGFVPINNNLINTKDISGIINENDMYDYAQARRGLWLSSDGWKARGEDVWRPTFTPSDKDIDTNNYFLDSEKKRIN